jgi:hypothetical protein
MLERQIDDTLGIEAITGKHLVCRADLSRTPDPVNTRLYVQGYAAYRRALTQLTPLYEPGGAKQ